MPVFIYKAKKITGELICGQTQAQTKELAAAWLDHQGLFPLTITQPLLTQKFYSRFDQKNIIEFTRGLAVLINAGHPLLASLESMLTQADFHQTRPMIADLISQIKDGKSFSSSLAGHPKIFSRFYLALVKVSETSGLLGQALTNAAEFLEEDLDFQTNLVSVLTYPLIVFGVGVVTVAVLLKLVIPKIVVVFSDFSQALPGPTQILIGLTEFINSYWLWIICLLIAIIAGLRNLVLRDPLTWDKRLLDLPVVGQLIKKIQVYRFTRGLSALLVNGVSVSLSLEVLINTVSNRFIKSQLEKARIQISHGSSLSQAFKLCFAFDSGFINLVAVGEESAKLGQVLQAASLEYAKDINRRLKTLLTLLEPILILGVGLVIGYIVLAMLLPIFSLDFNF